MEISASQKALIITTVFQMIPDCQALYLFGSHATGLSVKGSDIDLALLRPGRIEANMLLELNNKLSQALLLPIDLIDLHQASTIMRYEIIRQAQELAVTDTLASNLFASHSWSDYVEFTVLRQPMIDDIKARGYIYG